jgi:predicted ATPase
MHLNSVTIHPCRFPTREAYPFNMPLMQREQTIVFPAAVTFLTGENGTGKSTLIEAICRRCGIHIWEGAERRSFHVNRYEKMLADALDLQWADGPVPGSFFSPELFRNFTQLVDEWADSNPGLLEYFGGASLVTQSHGQSCMSFFRSIYKVKGVHFLDEPEAALSPKTQLALLDLLTLMSSDGHAQFIISTHSPILMSCPQATLYSFDGDAIARKPFQETTHFKIYKDFFRDSL